MYWLRRIDRAWDAACEYVAESLVTVAVLAAWLAIALFGWAVFAAKIAVLWGLLRVLFGF